MVNKPLRFYYVTDRTRTGDGLPTDNQRTAHVDTTQHNLNPTQQDTTNTVASDGDAEVVYLLTFLSFYPAFTSGNNYKKFINNL